MSGARHNNVGLRESRLEKGRPQNANCFSFDRYNRLPGAVGYKAVFDNSNFRVSHKNALLLARSNQSQYARLGLVISKKNVRRAVDRNRIKRLLREHFRIHKRALSGLDMVFMARGGLGNIEKPEIHKMFVMLFGHIQKQKS